MYWEIINGSPWVTAILITGHLIGLVFVIFNQTKEISSTWAWMFVLIFIPIIGLLAYLILGRPLKHKKWSGISPEEGDIPDQVSNGQMERLVSTHFNGNDLLNKYSKLIVMNFNSSHAPLSFDNEIKTFSHGHEKFEALLKDIRAAKSEINLQYYMFKSDQLGLKIRDQLIKKAKEKVKVRVLYDEIGSKSMVSSFFHKLVSYGGEVRVFFPSFLGVINFRINNRNHRKHCIIDGRIAYIGGFNIGNEYVGANKRYGYWRDTHYRIQGEAVNHIQRKFILDWRIVTKNKKDVSNQFSFQKKEHSGKSPVQVIASGPNSKTEHIKNMYIQLIMLARHSVYIQTPYFIPDTSFMEACKIALLSGVDIRIMIPNRDDHFIHWASRGYLGELLNYGATILMYEKGFLHAKTIVVDGEVASVGSSNLDIRSFKLNFEINSLVFDEKVANELQQLFLEDSKVSKELTLTTFLNRPLLQKSREAFARLLSPIL
ncbi:cardiolipin synthase [Aquibacillus sediminis]|uniref:cardiolipin synthase n=1 Tax=Aquibacillus sediminis TaxID=2574734 RepID=UPI001109B9B3|nr:cardiolipin synthase [Aquibacillus sediminis]